MSRWNLPIGIALPIAQTPKDLGDVAGGFLYGGLVQVPMREVEQFMDEHVHPSLASQAGGHNDLLGLRISVSVAARHRSAESQRVVFASDANPHAVRTCQSLEMR